MTIEPTHEEQLFIAAYLEAVDFTDTGDTDQPEAGTEMDPVFLRESTIECLAFYSRIVCYLSDEQITQAGHDFWLTRNGHGTGFWDREEIYGEFHANRFTEMAQSFGEAYSYYEGEDDGS
jgi:hypothetical protein